MVKKLLVVMTLGFFVGCGGDEVREKCEEVYDRLCAVDADCLGTGVLGYQDCIKAAKRDLCPHAVSVGHGGGYERCMSQLDTFECSQGLEAIKSCRGVVSVQFPEEQE